MRLDLAFVSRGSLRMIQDCASENFSSRNGSTSAKKHTCQLARERLPKRSTYSELLQMDAFASMDLFRIA
jgi:hypothetical protein